VKDPTLNHFFPRTGININNNEHVTINGMSEIRSKTRSRQRMEAPDGLLDLYETYYGFIWERLKNLKLRVHEFIWMS